MAKATLKAKSEKGKPGAFLWILLDHDGRMEATCHSAKSVTELLSKGALGLAVVKSKQAFLNQGNAPVLAGALFNPHTGKTL